MERNHTFQSNTIWLGFCKSLLLRSRLCEGRNEDEGSKTERQIACIRQGQERDFNVSDATITDGIFYTTKHPVTDGFNTIDGLRDSKCWYRY